MTRQRTRIAWFLGLVSGLALVLGVGFALKATAPAAAQQSPPKFRMILWGPRISEAGWAYLAEEQGLFREEGLEVEIIPAAGGGGEALKVLLAGGGDIAFVNPEALWFAVAEGAKLKSVYSPIPNSIFEVVSLPEKNIKSVRDLRGKKVGVLGRGSGTYYGLLSLLQLHGMKERDIEVVATGLDMANPLIRGQIDVLSTFEAYVMDMEKRIFPTAGKPSQLNKIKVKDFVNGDTDLFVVFEDSYRKNRDSVRKFLAAFRKGQQRTIENPQAGAAAAKKLARGATDDARTLEMTQWVVKIWQDAETKKHGLGWQKLDVLQKQVDIYHQAGLIKTRFDVGTVVTNEMIEELNRLNVPGGPSR
jgi:NitT/TauT family transport system substrate-binding protein